MVHPPRSTREAIYQFWTVISFSLVQWNTDIWYKWMVDNKKKTKSCRRLLKNSDLYLYVERSFTVYADGKVFDFFSSYIFLVSWKVTMFRYGMDNNLHRSSCTSIAVAVA